jgi:hypothetical protein
VEILIVVAGLSHSPSAVPWHADAPLRDRRVRPALGLSFERDGHERLTVLKIAISRGAGDLEEAMENEICSPFRLARWETKSNLFR